MSFSFKNYFRKIILNYINLILIRLNLPYLLFFIIKLTLKKKGNGKIKILAFERPIFSEDIKSLSVSTKCCFYSLDKAIFIQIMSEFIPELLLEHQEYYVQLKKISRSRLEKYKKFISILIKLFKEKLDINMIITANFNYSWQQEILVQSKYQNIKRIILYKEGINPLKLKGDIISPHKKQIIFYSNQNLQADLILTYNDNVKAAFDGIDFLDKKETSVRSIGIPRFYDLSSKKVSENNGVIFFSFDILEKSRQLNLSSSQRLFLENRINSFISLFSDFVFENQNIPILIKTKSNIKFLESAKKQFRRIINLPNVNFTNLGDSIDLILDRKLVIGFNSTTLVEAIILGKKVISMDSRDMPIECMFSNTQLFEVFCPKIDNLNFFNSYYSKKKINVVHKEEWLRTKSKFLGDEIINNFEKSIDEIYN